MSEKDLEDSIAGIDFGIADGVCHCGSAELLVGAVDAGCLGGGLFFEGMGRRGAHRVAACDAVRPPDSGQCAAGVAGG